MISARIRGQGGGVDVREQTASEPPPRRNPVEWIPIHKGSRFVESFPLGEVPTGSERPQRPNPLVWTPIHKGSYLVETYGLGEERRRPESPSATRELTRERAVSETGSRPERRRQRAAGDEWEDPRSPRNVREQTRYEFLKVVQMTTDDKAPLATVQNAHRNIGVLDTRYRFDTVRRLFGGDPSRALAIPTGRMPSRAQLDLCNAIEIFYVHDELTHHHEDLDIAAAAALALARRFMSARAQVDRRFEFPDLSPLGATRLRVALEEASTFDRPQFRGGEWSLCTVCADEVPPMSL